MSKYDFTKIKISKNDEWELWQLEYGDSGVIVWNSSYEYLEETADLWIAYYKRMVVMSHNIAPFRNDSID